MSGSSDHRPLATCDSYHAMGDVRSPHLTKSAQERLPEVGLVCKGSKTVGGIGLRGVQVVFGCEGAKP